jgi:exodeoxyribonuclease V beta subunit
MNLFFLPHEDFDTFHFAEGEQAIKYIPVNSPADNTAGQLDLKGKQCVPISVTEQSNKEQIEEAVAAQVIELLSNKEYTIERNNKERCIKPSDIGILVRQNIEADRIKAILTKYGIPAVTISDAKVLQSKEAVALLYVLEAIMDISRSKINRALLSSFTGYTVENILSLDTEVAIELFKKYKTNWDEDGIYTALMNFIVDFGVQQHLLKNSTENGERIITNLYQLIELLYKTQTNNKLSPMDLIYWLKRGIENEEAEGDEYEQRIENDEEAIKIVTIHSSKGLQYNIVLAPFLDLTKKKDEVICSFRDPEAGEYITLKKNQMISEQEEIYDKQTEQENRRLVYVAITRAVYKCFIYKNTSSHSRQSTLTFFTDALQYADPCLIERLPALAIPAGYFYRQTREEKQGKLHVPVRFRLLQNNWARLSYTMLAAEMEKELKIKSGNYTDPYDNFIFNQLTRGNVTGNLLHYIFENVHFTKSERWPVVVNAAIKRFAPRHKKEYEAMLMEMLQNVLNADIQIGDISFNLSEVEYEKRIHEFEFDFPVGLFQPAELENLGDENILISVRDRSNLEGMMNGKIDMLFECKDKYFVLDWKSTFLGDNIEDYLAKYLNEAMNESNYHLQYLIYTLAAKKYLESRLVGFDYEKNFGGVLYLFVRGIRKESSDGIFKCKPSLQQIDTLDRMLSSNLVVDSVP